MRSSRVALDGLESERKKHDHSDGRVSTRFLHGWETQEMLYGAIVVKYLATEPSESSTGESDAKREEVGIRCRKT